MALDMPVPNGEQLKAARVAAGLSQAQAAELNEAIAHLKQQIAEGAALLAAFAQAE